MNWRKQPFHAAVRTLIDERNPNLPAIDLPTVEAWSHLYAKRIAAATKTDVLQQILDALQGTISAGGTMQEFLDGLPAVFEAVGIDALQPWRAETIFQTAVRSAFGAGSWQYGLESDQWGWQYITQNDERVRDAHAALNGFVFKNGTHAEVFPPWGYRCRCLARWISKREQQQRGFTADSILPDEVEEELSTTSFRSPALGRAYNPDLTGVDPRLINFFNADVGGI